MRKNIIRLFLGITLPLLALTACDTVFDVHPYDTRVKGEIDMNAKNIAKIEPLCKDKDTLRKAVKSYTHQ